MSIPTPDPPLGDGEIVLRLLTKDDAPAVCAGSRDSETACWVPDPPPYTEEQARSFLAAYEEGRRAGTKLAFAVEEARTGAFVGSLVLQLSEPAVAEVAYWVRRAARGRGIATRALRLVSRWALAELGLAGLWLEIDPENAASHRVAERAGFRREGLLRSHCETNGRRHDCVVYSLLPSDLSGAPH